MLSNLIEGAALAIIVLALFLKDLRPTIVVAISMPLSVLFAIVLMYFTGITFNILSLSGLALGVGMLVDNSVVVIEKHLPSARARCACPPRVGAGRTAGGRVHRVLHPDDDLRIPAAGVHHRHGARTAQRYGVDDYLQFAGVPYRGADRRALRGFHGAEKAEGYQAPLVRQGAERL